MPRIILASQSPRRKQLLKQIGIKNFDILVPRTEEDYDPALSPEEIVSSICRKKAEAARTLAEDPAAVIITADTMVFLDGLRLGKPQDQVEAFTMLSVLSGRTHHVCTGVTLCRGERMETSLKELEALCDLATEFSRYAADAGRDLGVYPLRGTHGQGGGLRRSGEGGAVCLPDRGGLL